ncbi:Dabb family protein [Rudanella paleaurantiibacter]|uniref:Dabb family protein n=1 Tax=Rudanella paleaurantiibacter TaxID=2614655 RepID=A0A7J5TXW5_9BACT|nr:Dabb family protein [Rudanella paleaurantiibacter]KAB7729954.1 Dabb family protein [Rudanella paleaurantiibacter]
MNRRDFIQQAPQTVAAATLISPAAPESAPARPFVHHVYFWLANPDSEADRKQLLAALETLKTVPVIRQAYIGTPASTNRDVIDRSYQVSWLLFFDSLADEEVYQKHPIHLEFVKKHSHLWKKVVVYDSVSLSTK